MISTFPSKYTCLFIICFSYLHPAIVSSRRVMEGREQFFNSIIHFGWITSEHARRKLNTYPKVGSPDARDAICSDFI